MGVVVHVDSQIAQVLQVVERIGQVPELVFEEARTEAGFRGPLLEPMLSRDDVQSAVSIHVGDGNRFADPQIDRKSTRLNSSHVAISYAVFCLKKKKSTPRRGK